MDVYVDDSRKLLGFLPILNGEYVDMNADWYANVGTTVSFSLVLGVFSPHASYFAFTFMYMVFRWRDSGCRSIEQMKVPEGEVEANGGVDVYTKQMIQDDLNALWTGEEIYSHYIYATIYSYMWCILMYSTGLPILYWCGFLFFVIFYMVYKVLLLKFYKRTDRFNQTLPLEATANIPISLIIHLCFGAFMISNS